MYHFCTITTYSHLYKVKALADSLSRRGNSVMLHTLCIDHAKPEADTELVKYYGLTDVSASACGKQIIEKYANDKDKTRWSLKPVFLTYLLNLIDTDRVIYLDNDLCFFDDYAFLFDELQQHSFILTPHHYKYNPKAEQNWLEANYRVGLYNAGFVGVNKNAIPHLSWWADCCLYRCEKNPMRGLFDDQKYLDLIPIMCEDTKVLTHKGCNVADWNTEICKRVDVNGKTTINGVYPIVFIHFNVTTIRAIIEKREPLLNTFFEDYLKLLQKYNPSITIDILYSPYPIADKIKLAIWQWATRLGF
jgi:hypothetical protein